MKLTFGMVGGGGGFIGDVHRHAALMDDLAILTAGCFSRSMEKNRAFAEKWNLADPGRVYASYAEMAEKESTRADGIDFVSITTPNDTHYPIAKCFWSMASTSCAISRLRSTPRRGGNSPRSPGKKA